MKSHLETVRDNLRRTPLQYVGYDGSGGAIGSAKGWRDMQWAEDLIDPKDGEYDPLVEVTNDLCQRPMYYNMGWTTDHRMHLREPALEHARYLGRGFLELLGCRLQLTDCYRPPEVAQAGFSWAAAEVAQKELQMGIGDLKEVLGRICQGQEKDKTIIKRIAAAMTQADDLFCALTPVHYEPGVFGESPAIITAAANLSVIDLPLDRFGSPTHGAGNVIDYELVVVDTGKLYNRGVPVDAPGLVSHAGFFEPVVQTFSEAAFREKGLLELDARYRYYREEVRTRDDLRLFFRQAGVDLEEFLANDAYFREVCENITANRRAEAAVLRMRQALPFIGECWHVDLLDIFGGVGFERTHIPNGGPCTAVYLGHEIAVYGPATVLYDRIRQAA